eukprot:3632186-Rhodomonas_salina.1
MSSFPHVQRQSYRREGSRIDESGRSVRMIMNRMDCAPVSVMWKGGGGVCRSQYQPPQNRWAHRQSLQALTLFTAVPPLFPAPHA